MMIEKPNIKDMVAFQKGSINQQDRAAITSITNLLKQIDFTAEMVPANDPERLIKLLASLKGEQLNSSEVNVVYGIANKENEKLN